VFRRLIKLCPLHALKPIAYSTTKILPVQHHFGYRWTFINVLNPLRFSEARSVGMVEVKPDILRKEESGIYEVKDYELNAVGVLVGACSPSIRR
jgi:hypothetical protein